MLVFKCIVQYVTIYMNNLCNMNKNNKLSFMHTMCEGVSWLQFKNRFITPYLFQVYFKKNGAITLTNYRQIFLTYSRV